MAAVGVRGRLRVAELWVILTRGAAAEGCQAPTLTYASSREGRVFWPRSGCRMAKDPGAKLAAA
jgi:hypothetical protein